MSGLEETELEPSTTSWSTGSDVDALPQHGLQKSIRTLKHSFQAMSRPRYRA